MTEQLPFLVFKRKSSKRIQNMCKQYWTYSKTSERMTLFTLSLKELADSYNCEVEALKAAVAKECVASVACSLCQRPIPVADRRELTLLRIGGENTATCEGCTAYLRKYQKPLIILEQQEVFARPIISTKNPLKKKLYDQLLAYYPNVYPNLAPASFIQSSSPSYPPQNHAWFEFFLKTRVTFTICNTNSDPVAVIDWPESQGENSKETMMNFKRSLLRKSGIRYFVFPQDEELFLEEAETLRMYCWLSVHPVKLEQMLLAAQKREVMAFQLPQE